VIYSVLRAISAVALRWFYSRIDAEGVERIPAVGPTVLVVNHPNAMVDALVVGVICPRPIVFTGKATLFSNPLFAAFLRSAGVVPLVRVKDAAQLGAPRDAIRNEASFDALTSALGRGACTMIFPEGVTGDWTQLAPLKTGAARIAFQARDAGVRGLKIVPVGLTFERKDAPRTRVFAQVGDPIDIDRWPRGVDDARLLTGEIDRRLRAVTLNFESSEASERNRALAAQIARLFHGAQAVPNVWEHAPLSDEVDITRRIEDAQSRLESATPEQRSRADALLARLSAFRVELRQRRMAVEDLEIPLDIGTGVRFTVREVAVIALLGPIAIWGWVNHIIPFNVARTIAMRSVESGADPAMRTINFGLALVLAVYIVQGAAVATLFGAVPALAYVISLPIAADVNFRFRPRLARAIRRARTYLRFRSSPDLQQRLSRELAELRTEALAVEDALRVSR
jgi:glycerol-3-phosphate O-acyltransferase/dihydroxyacetone phosphate acyltransferase